MRACLQELRKRLEENHGKCAEALTKKNAADAQAAAAVSPDAPNVLQAMMQLEQAKTRAKTDNKLVLETEKEKDADEQAVEASTVRCFFSRCGEALCEKAIQ